MKIKKLFSFLCFMMIALAGGLLSACEERYANLGMNAGFVYTESQVEKILENGYKRIVSSTGAVFDYDEMGNYIFYVKEGEYTSANFYVDYYNTPDNFNFDADIGSSIVNLLGEEVSNTYTSSGVIKRLKFSGPGSTTLIASSKEGGKEVEVNVKVVQIASSMTFKKDNYALTKANGSQIDLSRNKVLDISPIDSSEVDLTYSFGYYDGDIFNEYDTATFWSKGLYFDKIKNILKVTSETVGVEDLVVKVTYNNPIGENLYCFTAIDMVNDLEFELFYGDENDIPTNCTLANKVGDEIKDLIVNISELNYFDIILKAKSNGENISLNYLTSGDCPVKFVEIFEQTYYKDENQKNNYTQSNYCYKVYRVVASKKTTQNTAIYGKDGIYNLKFACNYQNYTVDDYPLISSIKIKNDSFVKTFSVNKQTTDEKNIYYSKVYLNSDEISTGTMLTIDVANPISVLKENANFSVELRDSNGVNITNQYSNYFRILQSKAEGYAKTNADISKQTTFNRGTVLYIYPNELSGNLSINDVFYLYIIAEKPIDHDDKKAKAKIELSIVEGISSFEDYDFAKTNYLVDSQTGRYIKLDLDSSTKVYYDINQDKYYKLVNNVDIELTDIDSLKLEYNEKTNKYYKQEQNGAKVEREGCFITCTTTIEDVLFDDINYTGEDIIYLDYSSGFEANMTLNYVNIDADISNLEISSSDLNILEIIDDDNAVNENGHYSFNIKPKGVGECFVNITTSNLGKIYKIPVSVYKPISNFYVNLSSINLSSGIGYYSLDNNEKNVTDIVSSYGKSIYLIISTLPIDVKDYSLNYTVYKVEESEDMELATYSVGYNGEKIGNYIINDANFFSFNCQNNSFIFPETYSVDYKYKVLIKLENLDGSYFNREINLSCYIPVESINVTTTNSLLYNPNTISYLLKTQDIDDPTVIGIKVEVNKNSVAKATFSFENYGCFEMSHNNNTENFFVSLGQIQNNVNNNILLPISLFADAEGFYWFKLNENYNYSNGYGLVFISLKVKEFDKTFIKTISLKVVDANRVDNIFSNQNSQIYFKQGRTEDENVSLQLQYENSYDKRVLYRVFDVLTIENKTYFIDVSNANGVLKNINLVGNVNNSGSYSFVISPNIAGNSAIVFMPEDKIISKTQYDSFYNYSYVSMQNKLEITEETFYQNYYYYKDNNGNYILALEFSEIENKEVFIKVVETTAMFELWKDYLAFYISVADGIKVPYQLSTINDIYEISSNYESVTKRYVMINDIVLDTKVNFVPIGNYYVVDINSSSEYTDLSKISTIYVKNNLGEFKENTSVWSQTVNDSKGYYCYGFNGEISGKYSFINLNNYESIQYYSISNLVYAGTLDNNNNYYGFCSILGQNSKISYMSVSYEYFQPIINNALGCFSFGGIAGENKGKIYNCNVMFKNFYLKDLGNANIGGLVGVNNGVIENIDTNFCNLNGEIKISLKDDANLTLGGMVGENNKIIIGCYSESGEIKPIYQDEGFNSSLTIDISSNKANGLSCIGGAIGSNNGFVMGVAIQGEINALNVNNVGGIIGKAINVDNIYNCANDDSDFINAEDNNIEDIILYNSNNEIIKSKYSIVSCYSIAKVSGKDYVGGAIGLISGNSTNLVKVFYTSAENYCSDSTSKRPFVLGNDYVGGFVGKANFSTIKYCYAVSYFENDEMETDDDYFTNQNYFDVIAKGYCSGFICSLENTSVNNCASIMNTFCNSNSDYMTNIFITSIDNSSEIYNCFAQGVLSSGGEEKENINIQTKGYYKYYHNSKDENVCAEYINGNKYNSVNISNFNDSNWGIKNNVPYLKFNGKALFVTTPIEINLIIKDFSSEEELKYIKNDATSLVVFFNNDYYNKYPELADEIKNLNIYSIDKLLGIHVIEETYKSYRLSISSSNTKVVDIINNNQFIVLGEGKTTITVSSKLNYNYSSKIDISVCYGVSNVNVYTNVSFTTTLNDEKIDLLKNKSFQLYSEDEYSRKIFVDDEKKHYTTVELKSLNNIGVRFSVLATDIDGILTTSGVGSLNEIFKISGYTWLYDSSSVAKYYVDISSNVNLIINPILAIDEYIKVSYTPFFEIGFNSSKNNYKILLDSFSGDFKLNIKHGATDFKLESNIDDIIKISQLQTQVVTITMNTDLDGDSINAVVYKIDYDYYFEESLGNIIFNGNGTNIKNLSNNNVSFILGETVKNRNAVTNAIESITVTYTINYKDKINAIEKDELYRIDFQAGSNNLKYSVGVVFLGQDKINQLYSTVYAQLNDFPQEPVQNNFIYNGIPGVMSLEVYPYFSNYSKLRLRYETDVNYSMLITQLSYDIEGNEGQKLTNYASSGSIVDENEYLWIEKSSGQDTYLFNTLGTYSYSKVYFISMLVPSSVPDNSIYTIYVDILNKQNDIIDSYSFNVNTIAKPNVELSFDKELLGSDGKYYIPINTSNNLDVAFINYDGDINWNIYCSDENFNLSLNTVNALTPVKDENENYTFSIYNYKKDGDDTTFDSELLGHTIVIECSFIDNKISYSTKIEVLVTLFTIKGVSVQNVSNGYMTLPLVTSSPLFISFEEDDIYYDTSLTNSQDNWYTELYSSWQNNTADKGNVYNYLKACGYEIEEDFSNYFIQLKNLVSKVSYNYNDASTQHKSGVWYYDGAYEKGFIEAGREYNNSVFGVELYSNYFAVYGNQIDINTNMFLRVNFSYSAKLNKTSDQEANGIPNIVNYDVSIGNSFKSIFSFEQDFILNFTYSSDLINAVPVSTQEEFENMKEGVDYRLVNDIELVNYTPISTKISSLDGNNYTLHITSFSYTAEQTDECFVGLFESLESDAILYNITVNYTDKIIQRGESLLTANPYGSIVIDLPNCVKVLFGGLIHNNYGAITNCCVKGKVQINASLESAISNNTSSGLVLNNEANGSITNSKVKDFELTCYGLVGGFIFNNSGKIVSSYFINSSINNLSNGSIGGFVYTNSGDIYECFIEGSRRETDSDIRNTGSGLTAKGIISGFVYTNSGSISDCYSNITLSSSTSISGFISYDTSESIISRCYAICYKAQTDNNTVASPFARAEKPSYKITINGTLNDCFYLSGTNNWIDNYTWANTSANKVAKGLNFDEFSTHSSFVNYDLSITYDSKINSSGTNEEKITYTYADGSVYHYVEGYTWVIMEGKPVLVSTLVNTISQRDYGGKSKNYSTKFNYYVSGKLKVEQISGTTKTNYYDEQDNLIYYTLKENTKEDKVFTLTYTFLPRDIEVVDENGKVLEDSEGNIITYDKLTLVYSINEILNTKTLTFAYYGDENPKLLDFKDEIPVSAEEGYSKFVEDENYRANDTIFITEDADGKILNIDYYVLENASYYYYSATSGVSNSIGTRTNPQIIYDYESFVYYLSANTTGKYYRVIKDIDFEYAFTKTSFSNFQGVLQGNYMNLDRISISYLKEDVEFEDDNLSTISFGLFAQISTINNSSIADFNSTMISNLSLNIVEVLSNSHSCVGALAGSISASANLYSNYVILSNISISGYNEQRAYVQGKNAVGGLVGFAQGNVIIKDIDCSVNVNAVKEMSITGDGKTLLFEDVENITNVSYAGGVIGIFDANEIKNNSTKNNYNANDVYVYGQLTTIGGIVGSAFGMLGKETIVNYVNTVISDSSKNFLKSITYAGGLVGENRGKIMSSSIGYGSLESYVNVSVAFTDLIKNNYFYNGTQADGSLAIGGLVGLNNGGVISNSITTVNVRNKYSRAAGGAVGKMVEGTLENVIASGSVLAELNIGGFIGILNNESMFDNMHSANAFNKNIEDQTKNTVIKDCVACNNWLYKDYITYKSMLKTTKTVAGFIGLISYNVPSGSASDYDYYDFIKFEGKNYFSNTVYSSTDYSKAQIYLKPAYSSSGETITNIKNSIVDVLHDRKYTSSEQKQQAVFPYSTRQMYYEDTETDSYYKISTKINAPTDTGVVADPTCNYYYALSDYNNIENISDLYSEIDLTQKEVWKKVHSDTTGDFISANVTFDYLKNRFGKIYNKNADGNFVEVTASTFSGVTNEQTGYYFIGKFENKTFKSPILDNFTTKEYFSTNVDSIVLDDSVNTFNEIDFVYEKTDKLETIKSIVINGIEYEISYDSVNSNETSFYFNVTSNPLPNGEQAKQIIINTEEINNESTEHNDCLKVTDLTVVKYYEIDDRYITNETEDESTYTLNISSKKVIYNSFSEGFWQYNNFYQDYDYANADKYLTNLKYTTIYRWDNFTTDSFIDNDFSDGLEIYTAEELALLAKCVNERTTVIDNSSNLLDYSNLAVSLANNIDLSGKYWVPIGTETNCFSGTFDGKNHTISYVIVNENSSINQNILDYVGLFGVVNNATVKDLCVSGGDIYGVNAGGLIGKATNCTIENVQNKNEITGITNIGGFVGLGENITFKDDSNVLGNINYGNIYYENEKYNNKKIINIGGFVGEDKGEIRFDELQKGIINYGLISVFSNATSYASSTNPCLWGVNVGGVVGNCLNIYVNTSVFLSNYGEISVRTNAHELNVGGVIGLINGNDNISKLKNYAKIEISYSNSQVSSQFEETSLDYQNDLTSSKYFMATAFVGGAVGNTKGSVIISGNEGNIHFNTTTTTISTIAVGGVVGGLSGYYEKNLNEQIVSQCYNSNDITISSISSLTKVGIGGIVGLVNASDSNALLVKTEIKRIDNSYNSGEILSNSNSYVYMGGILGGSYYEKDIFGSQNTYKNLSTNILENYENLSSYDYNDIKVYVLVKNCYNIGNVNIISIQSIKNALGSLVGASWGYYDGDDDFCSNILMDSNFYLRGCAFSDNKTFTNSCYYVENSSTESSFECLSDSPMIDGVETNFAVEKISTSLKDKSTYPSSWIFDDITNPDVCWEQSFTTWYPTLINNNTSSLWSDKQESISQERGCYTIRSAEELSYLASQINSGNLKTDNITIRLLNSIDLSNRYWIPIGTKTNPFSGVFDGNGYSLKNLTINGKTDKNTFGGLFGYVVNGLIKNVGIEAPIINNVDYAGSIACFVSNSRIEKVYSEMGSNADSEIGADKGLGGLVYSMTGCTPLEENDFKGGLYYSFNDVPVVKYKEFEKSNNEDLIEIGGLVGVLNNSFISNSYNNSHGLITEDENDQEESIHKWDLTVATEKIGVMIAGNVKNSSSLVNVFSLAQINYDNYNVNSPSTYFDKYLFVIEDDVIKIKSDEQNTPLEPTFENLEGNLAELKTIWTNEYSLNDANYSNYPYLRGLGKEWKNTESEKLISYNYLDAGIIDIEKIIEERVLDLIDKNILSQNTLVKVVNDVTNAQDDGAKTIYLITSEEELAWISNNVNAGNISTRNCQFILLKDLDLTGRFWTPIGLNSVYPFEGIFNFNGHSIKGMTIDTENLSYGGLFGYTSNAYITNGYVVNAFIKVKSTNERTNVFVGTLVGKGYNTTIENIYVTTNLNAQSGFSAYVGGIIGFLTGSSNYYISNVSVSSSLIPNSTDSRHIDISSFINCVVESSVDETQSDRIKEDTLNIGAFSTGGNVYCGGIVGYIRGNDLISKSTDNDGLNTVRHAKNEANIVAVSTASSTKTYLGGIVGWGGYDDVSIDNVQNSGKLKSYGERDILGGIVGYLYNGVVKNSYFNGYLQYRVEKTGKDFSLVGGIIGEVEGCKSLKYCINDGELYQEENAKNYASIGGIIGHAIDHFYSNDKSCLYSKDDFSFRISVGTNNYSENYEALLNNMSENDRLDSIIYEDENNTSFNKFYNLNTTPISITQTGEGFLSKYWGGSSNSSIKFVIPHILLKGDEIFTIDNQNLFNNTVLVNSLINGNVFVNDFTLEVDKDEIAFGIVDKNFNYYYLKTTIELVVNSDNEINIYSLIQKANTTSIDFSENNIIACFIEFKEFIENP